jgi:hypothetical protein
VREFEAAHPDEPEPDEGAQQEISEYDAKLRQHRAALEAGADPVLVTSWMKETQARRARGSTAQETSATPSDTVARLPSEPAIVSATTAVMPANVTDLMTCASPSVEPGSRELPGHHGAAASLLIRLSHATWW